MWLDEGEKNSPNCLMIRVWIEESLIKRRISKRLLHFDSDWKADISNLNVSFHANRKYNHGYKITQKLGIVHIN